MNNEESCNTSPLLGKLAVYVFFEAMFVAGLLFKADSPIEYALGGGLSAIGFCVIVDMISDWFKERRKHNRPN
jgi:hypothetical protein